VTRKHVPIALPTRGGVTAIAHGDPLMSERTRQALTRVCEAAADKLLGGLPSLPYISVGSEIARSAKISECGRYRYALTRTWNAPAGEALFVCLNPSTADGLRDDPTIRKCLGFARRWGMGGIRVANLFAYRATKPQELRRAQKRGVDIVGPMNDEHLLALAHGAGRVVVAWGAHAEPYDVRVNRVLTLLAPHVLNQRVWCFGVSKQGHPLHPLMLQYSTPLQNVKVVI
jgi:hypothetical protein